MHLRPLKPWPARVAAGLLCLWSASALAQDTLEPIPEEAPCPDPDMLVSEAEALVVQGALDETLDLTAEAYRGLACGPAVEPELLARLLLVDGVRLHLSGDPGAAEANLAAAARVSPETWLPAYGAALDGVRSSAAAAAAALPAGELHLEPPPERFSPVLDGLEIELPAPAAAGLHLLQVLDTDGLALSAQLVAVPPGDTLVVDTGPLVSRGHRRPFPWLLATAGVFAAGSGVAAWQTVERTQDMRTAPGFGALDQALEEQKTWTALTWTGAGLAGACVGLHIAL